MAVWAGARFQRRPKAVFSRRRCTVMKVSMETTGIAAGDHGEDREQQNVGQLIELPSRRATDLVSVDQTVE